MINHLSKFKPIDYIVLLLVLVVVFVEAKGEGDFHIYLQASKDIFRSENIYQKLYHDWFHYYYDSFFAIILYPFTFLPFYLANVLWLGLNALLAFATIKRLWKFFPNKNNSIAILRWTSYFAYFFLWAVWLRNIHVGQITIVILYLCVEGLYRIQNQKLVLGSFLLAIGISIKIMPLVLLPYLIYRGYFKAVGFVIFFTLLLLFIPVLFLGIDYQMFLLEERWGLLNPSNAIHVLDVEERSFHSLSTLVSVLFVENARNNFTLEYSRNITDVSMETLGWIINSARIFFVLLTFYFLEKNPFQKASSDIQSWYELSYILLVAPLIFPHQQHYAFWFALPAVLYLFYIIYLKHKSKSIVWGRAEKWSVISFMAIIFILLNSHLFLGVYKNVFDHFKTFTYGVLLLIPLLMYFNPNKINIENK